jgi:hypothetical protein
MIVTISPTVMDGQVVRWYASEAAAEHGDSQMSASRHGVLVHCFLHLIPAEHLAEAQRLYGVLRDGGQVPDGVATHRRLGGRRIMAIAGHFMAPSEVRQIEDMP